MICLGFDTSNYTTSTAAYDEGTQLNIRRILTVGQGERGLRQSDAVFQHLKELPELFSELAEKIDKKEVLAVGVSTRPRSVEGSYMPVFLAGEGYARVCADSLGVPLYRFSHQDGHIMAGIYSCHEFELLSKKFISVHLSGGTCEILLCRYNGYNFDCEIIGGSRDISAGQLIDRVGVKMGLQFPCGKELEQIAKKARDVISLPVNTDGAYINFSGIETKAISLIGKENDESLAKSLFVSVAKALERTLNHCIKKYEIENVLIVGGVASNSIIKENLNLCAKKHFASVEYSTDNAVGIAILAHMANKGAGTNGENNCHSVTAQ